MMKKRILLFITLLISASIRSIACELCSGQQPKLLKDVTHGTGPEGNLDYIIIWTAVIIVGFTLIWSIKLLISPKENNPDHIKFIPLSDHQKN